jgi:hypothetical protein
MALLPRKIGSNLVHPIGYGAMGMSAFYGPGLSDEEAFKVSHALYSVNGSHYPFRSLTELWSLDARISTLLLFTKTVKKLSDDGAPSLIDDAISCTHSTRGTYRLKKSGNRDKVCIATKFAIDQQTGQIRGDPEFVREQWERSAKRLGVDCIDLFYQHR